MDEPRIGLYNVSGSTPVVGLRPWNPLGLKAAEKVIQLLHSVLPDLSIEHVGSTSVPGCDGKGILDLMIVVPQGRMEEICSVVDRLGFQRQSAGVQHPDDRPMREGSIEFEGTVFRLHVHLTPEGTPLPDIFRKFRDQLRANPELIALYIDQKRRLVDAQITDRATYSKEKSAFVESVLRRGQ